MADDARREIIRARCRRDGRRAARDHPGEVPSWPAVTMIVPGLALDTGPPRLDLGTDRVGARSANTGITTLSV
ncbi:hypothetical protein ACQPYK_07745 [Streptosporangium sp. CA-135522]|uniref:hypothetical protein n=1 Tax=Streptosporangium sp. CA-135522 TaxID=3240072 RepID=UPI003D8CCBC3